MTVSFHNRRLLARQFASLVLNKDIFPQGLSSEQQEIAAFMFYGGAAAYVRASLSGHTAGGWDASVHLGLQEELLEPAEEKLVAVAEAIEFESHPRN